MPSYPRSICREEEGEFPGGSAGGWPLERPARFKAPRPEESQILIPVASRPKDKQRIDEDGEPDESLEETVQGQSLSERGFLRIMEERKSILANDKLSARQKKQLLDTSRIPLAVVSSRGLPFKTEEVVRWMLIYSMAVVIILALLTAFANLQKEVTISFIGTVIGGMIATVAQKLGKIGK